MPRKNKMKIKFPRKILKPIENFLRQKENKLKKQKEDLKKEDPYTDTSRVNDNAASDAEAAEESGHERITALRKEIDKALIEIRKTLTRIRLGKYGTCEKCGRMINTDRLAIKPTATLCIECEKKKIKIMDNE